MLVGTGGRMRAEQSRRLRADWGPRPGRGRYSSEVLISYTQEHYREPVPSPVPSRSTYPRDRGVVVFLRLRV